MHEAQFRAAIAEPHGPLPHPRFGVYRHNVSAGLVMALAVRYPALRVLLGEPGFAALAGDFTAAGHRPESPVLIGYGAGLPAFLGDHQFIKRWPFAADLAELESRWWGAYHAREVEALPAQAFALDAGELETVRFVFHPSASLLEAQWPVGFIWQQLKNGGVTTEVAPAAEALLLWRPEADVLVQRLAPGRAAFLRKLINGASLAAAVEATLALHSGFDLQSELQALIGASLITRIDRTS